MSAWFERYRSWSPGLLVALAGVACVRLVAPHLAPGRLQSALVIAGYLAVPVGLALVARCIHRAAVDRAGAA